MVRGHQMPAGGKRAGVLPAARGLGMATDEKTETREEEVFEAHGRSFHSEFTARQPNGAARRRPSAKPECFLAPAATWEGASHPHPLRKCGPRPIHLVWRQAVEFALQLIGAGAFKTPPPPPLAGANLRNVSELTSTATVMKEARRKPMGLVADEMPSASGRAWEWKAPFHSGTRCQLRLRSIESRL